MEFQIILLARRGAGVAGAGMLGAGYVVFDVKGGHFTERGCEIERGRFEMGFDEHVVSVFGLL
jgi:hypothetical protein